jgi:hypothetical protein
VLWADAVYVDQSNIPERNHEVVLMRRIYEQIRFGSVGQDVAVILDNFSFESIRLG